MRTLTLLGCAAAFCAFAGEALAYPTGAEALEVRLLAKMGPAAKVWIVKEGAREAAMRSVSGENARSAAIQYGASGANLDALTFLVLMRAERDADAAVRGVAEEDMSERESEQDARKAQQSGHLTAYAQQSQLSGEDQLVSSAQGSAPISLLPPTPGSKPAVLEDAAPQASPPPPGINLQDAMDRESQLDDLVADAMKQIPPTQESAVTAMP
jgi:hypothetical protein